MDSLQTLTALRDTFFIIRNKPLEIIDKSPSGIDYWTIISTLVAVAGIFFFVYDRVKRPKLAGKIVSLVAMPGYTFTSWGYEGQKIELAGQAFIIKFSLGAYLKELSFDKLDIYVNFQSVGRQKAVPYWINKESINIDGKRHYLSVPSDAFLPYLTFLEKDKLSFYYLRFVVEGKTDSDIFSDLELVFTRLNGRTSSVRLTRIDAAMAFSDPELLTPA